MKLKILAILIMLIFVCYSHIRAQETSVIAIEGSVFSNDGATLAPNGWNVDVTNKTQNLKQSSITGEAGDGRYSVTFIDLGGGILAATGDEIEIVVTDADGNKQESATYILTDEDIDIGNATIDVVVTNVHNELPRWDVNGDGQVDISDLVLVGRHFGETIEEPVPHNPDVNGDGTVDINDLVLIGTPHRPVPPAEIVVVETGDPQVPIVAIHESGSGIAVLFDETQNKLQGAVYFSEKGDEFTVLVGEDGLPTQAFANGYVLLYENYTDHSVDIAIISPEGEIEVFRNISWSAPKQAYRATMRASSEEEDGFLAAAIGTLNVAGTAASIGSCVLSMAAPKFWETTAACGSAITDTALLADSSSVPLWKQKGWDIVSIGYNLAGCAAQNYVSCASVGITSAKNVLQLIETLVEIFTEEIAVAKEILKKKDSTSEDEEPLENGKINSRPLSPDLPYPSDDEKDVEPGLITLSWVGGDPDVLDKVYYDVYFGSAHSPPLVSSKQEFEEYSTTLSVNTTYYWQVVAMDDVGNTTFGPVWSFTTRAAHSPELAFAPKPPDGAADQPTKLTLSWTASHPDSLPMTFDVHLGTATAVAMDRLPRVKENLTESECGVSELKNNETYFWQVITKDDQGNSTPGLLWSFSTTASNQPPDLPFNPSPSNDAKGIGRGATLSWSAYDPDGDPMTYDVYLDTWGPIPITVEDINESGYIVGPLVSDLEVPQYTPPTMKPNETYFWRVVVKDNTGNSTVGEHWSFSTELNSPPDPPFNPSPSDKGTNVDTDSILSWSAYDPDGDPMTYEVFVNVTSELSQSQTLYPFYHNLPHSPRDYLEVPQFIPACSYDRYTPWDPWDYPLRRNTTYFWKVVVRDNVGNSTEGDVWSFTTGPRPAYLSSITSVGLSIPIKLKCLLKIESWSSWREHRLHGDFYKSEIVETTNFGRSGHHSWGSWGIKCCQPVVPEDVEYECKVKWEGNSFFGRDEAKYQNETQNGKWKWETTLEITGTFSADFDRLSVLRVKYEHDFKESKYLSDKVLVKEKDYNIHFSLALSNVPITWSVPIMRSDRCGFSHIAKLDVSSCEAEGEAKLIIDDEPMNGDEEREARTWAIESVENCKGVGDVSLGVTPCLP